MPLELTVTELNELHRLEYLGAEAFDNRDVDMMRKLCAPNLKVNFSDIGHGATEMTLDDYLKFLESKIWSDSDHVRHQSFLGGGYYEKVSEDYIIGYRQIMTVYIMHKDHNHGDTTGSSQGLGARETYFRKIDSKWFWSGNAVKMRAFGEGYESLPHAKKLLPGDRAQWIKEGHAGKGVKRVNDIITGLSGQTASLPSKATSGLKLGK